jgi:hypothetical protein
MSELLHTFRRKSPREKAATLVVTLLVLTLLSAISVAFIQSVSMERSAARSTLNRYQAELLADAAVDEAAARVISTIRTTPYSAAYYPGLVAGTPSLHLYLARYATVGGNNAVERVPLFSTQFNIANFNNPNQTPIQTAAISVTHRSTQGGNTTSSLGNPEDIYTDLNYPTPQHPNGLVGLFSTAGRTPLIGNWIYVTNSSGAVSGRYAFWMDDESSKIDLRTAGTATRGNGTNLAEVSLESLNLTPPQINNLTNLRNATQVAPSLSTASLIVGAGNTAWEAIRPFTTIYSLHDVRSQDGRLSVNLNSFVNSTASPVQKVNTISDAISANIPTFGTRYFQDSGTAAAPSPIIPSTSNQTIYNRKIAANIKDFIDTDNNPTVLDGNGAIYSGTDPTMAGRLPYNSVLAADIPVFGKERGPFLNEYAVAFRVISPENTAANSSANVTITLRVAYYVELFNPTSRRITAADLGPDPRIIIANQLPWENARPGQLPFRPADIVMNLPNNFEIAPRGYAVLTTDGPPFTTTTNQQTFFTVNQTATFYTLTRGGSNNAAWSLLGTPDQNQPINGQYVDYSILTRDRNDSTYTMQMNNGSTPFGYGEARERILFVNNDGILDYTLRVYSGDRYLGRNTRNPVTLSTFVPDGRTSSRNTTPDGVNNPRIVRGDPRSNTEIIQINPDTSSVWKSGNSPQYGNNIGLLQLTLGGPNFNWVFSTGNSDISLSSWAEFNSMGNGYIENGNMTAGDLGFIFDPARFSSAGYRSMSRSLRVGQPDRPDFNRNRNSTVEADISWLGGLGSNMTTSANYTRSAFHLASVFRFDDFIFGKLNPNGIARSPSSPIIDSLFKNFRFELATQGRSSGQIAGQSANTNALSAEINNELSAGRPFLGIGDLSRLQVFGTSSTANSIVAGQDMSDFNISDADREETFRRTSGLLSTQSLAYSIFAVGQSGTIVNNRFIPTATQRKQVVVQFQPIYSNTQDYQTYLQQSDNGQRAQPLSWRIIKPWQKNL